MTNDCKTCPVSTGTHKPAEALHQIAEPDAQHLQELAAYRFTVENLRARVAELEERLEIDYRHPYDGIAARDATIKALEERIAELEADLEAVGAGGVEPLRKRAAAPQAVQAAYPHLPHSVADVVDFMDGRGVDVDFSHPAPAGGTSLYTAAQMHAYVDADRAQRAATSPEIVKLDRGFRWDSEKQHHVPTLLIEFTPVPANSPNTEKGWADRDALAAALAAPAHPAEGVPAQEVTYAEARECEHCNHVGINDSAEGVATCVACQWIGDSPKEDKCPDCEAEGTMTASCPKCHHEYRLIADATLAATHPTQQGLEQDAARWRMVALISKEVMIHPDKRTAADAVSAYMHAVHSGLDIQGAIDAALAAQAKQGEQANG